MASVKRIKASDGTGNASVATVQTLRAPLATTQTVDTVVGIYAGAEGFYATMGTPHTFTDPITSEVITVISDATAVDFQGHIDTGHIIIDAIAPGYTDLGSKVGDIIVIRPTTQWSNNASDTLAIAHNDDGTIKAPQGQLFNGKIVSSVASNNLTIAIKTLAGADPSAADPVYININGTMHSITAALSVTKNAGTNWFNAGVTGLATQEIDYFVYLGFNATDGVTLGFARIPYARVYSDFSATTTNDKYAAISNITHAAATDAYENVGRFNAILGVTASFNWSLPVTSIVINRPIFYTRLLTLASGAAAGWGSFTTAQLAYKINGSAVQYFVYLNGTSNAALTTALLPISPNIAMNYYEGQQGLTVDNGVVANPQGRWSVDNVAVTPAVVLNITVNQAGGNFTASGSKTTRLVAFYEI